MTVWAGLFRMAYSLQRLSGQEERDISSSEALSRSSSTTTAVERESVSSTVLLTEAGDPSFETLIQIYKYKNNYM